MFCFSFASFRAHSDFRQPGREESSSFRNKTFIIFIINELSAIIFDLVDFKMAGRTESLGDVCI